MTMALPVAGLGLAEVHRKMSAFVAVPALIGLLALGLIQMRQEHNASWDPRPVASHLAQEAEPGDVVHVVRRDPQFVAAVRSVRSSLD